MTEFVNPEYGIFNSDETLQQMIEVLGLELNQDPLDGISVVGSTRKDVLDLLTETKQQSLDAGRSRILAVMITLAKSSNFCRFNATNLYHQGGEDSRDGVGAMQYRTAPEIAMLCFHVTSERIMLTRPSVEWYVFPSEMEGGYLAAP